MAPLQEVKCPTCGTQVKWHASSPFRPFCSERCRTMDLGDWAAERRRIAGDPLDAPPDATQDPAVGNGSD